MAAHRSSIRIGTGIIAWVVIAAACSSSSNKAHVPSPAPSVVVQNASKSDALALRVALGQVPYTGGAGTCRGGRLVTSLSRRSAAAEVVLPDSTHSSCYLLGPTLLDGRHVKSADVVEDTTTAAWIVKISFANDDFVTKVATPYVNQQVAIVVDGVVQSAPKIDPGITGRDITIAGEFTRASAQRIAERIAPAGTVQVELPTTPTTRPPNPLRERCQTVGSRLGFSISVGGSPITAATARAAYARAHQTVPARLADGPADEMFALCYFLTTPVTPPSICPNGRIVMDPGAAARSTALYAVNARLNAIRLPSMEFVFPGLETPSNPSSCGG